VVAQAKSSTLQKKKCMWLFTLRTIQQNPNFDNASTLSQGSSLSKLKKWKWIEMNIALGDLCSHWLG
jgi:hypothetical protein